MFGSKQLRCPKCKGTTIQIQMVETGSKTKKSGNGLGGNAYNAARGIAGVATLGLSNVILPKAKGKEKTVNNIVKVGLCQSCGHSWEIKK